MRRYFEVEATEQFDPTTIVSSCIESGANSLLLDEIALPTDFFDLSSGLAGELLHRLSIYRMRMAVVVADPSKYSSHFQALVREANSGQEFRFFTTRQEAIQWLESE
ncbi:MAG: DUF4180 domain-containing protein [Anaerolineales bacterium]|nr:MAG: DUF4180 domain-containing protein [Anaerolineales bacterium]